MGRQGLMKPNYDKEEVKQFIRDLWKQIPDVQEFKSAEIEIDSSRQRQKDIEQHNMYVDTDWNWSGLR